MKKLGVFIALVLAAVGGLAYYYWWRFTRLPTWYTNPTVTPAAVVNPRDLDEATLIHDELMREIEASLATANQTQTQTITELEEALKSTDAQTKPPKVTAKASPLDAQPAEINLEVNAPELSSLAVKSLAELPGGQEVLNASSRLNTTVSEQLIETGLILNTSELDIEALSAQKQALIRRAIDAFPPLQNRDVYVAIAGQPRVAAGQLQFDQTTQIKVGNLRMTIGELAQRLNLSPAVLENNLTFGLDSLDLTGVELGDGYIVIRGSERQP